MLNLVKFLTFLKNVLNIEYRCSFKQWLNQQSLFKSNLILGHCILAKSSFLLSQIRVLALLSAVCVPLTSHGQLHSPALNNSSLYSLGQDDYFKHIFDTEVWFSDMSERLSQFIPDPTIRVELLKAIQYESSKANLQPELILALIQTESAFDQYAVSSAGAQGFMQVMPFWKHVIGHDKDNLTAMETNLKYGCAILSHYLEKEQGNLTRALARYNGSLGKTWYPERVYDNLERYWFND